jgi:hypothetical protein
MRGVHFWERDQGVAREYSPIKLYRETKLAMIFYGKAIRDKAIRRNLDDIYM